jgi:DNA repair photolyase
MHHSFKDAGESPFGFGYSIVDPDTPERVGRDAGHMRNRGLIQLCTTVDAWAPEAQEHNLGRRCLAAILAHPDWTVRVLTKNGAVQQDYDLIRKHRDRVLVGLSLTATPSRKNRMAVVEPNASTITQRLAALRKAHRLGLRTYGMLCPLLPGIADDHESISELVGACIECGAEEIFVELRDFAAARELTGRVANLLALVCGEQNNTRDEIHYAERAARLNPESPVLVGNYGCVLAETGMTDQAIAKMRLALQMDPKLDYLYERLGNLYRQQGKEEEALREFRQAIRVLEKRVRSERESPERWSDLARLYHKTGDYDRAAEAQSKSADAHLNEVFEGDHRHRVAGPDSGF